MDESTVVKRQNLAEEGSVTPVKRQNLPEVCNQNDYSDSEEEEETPLSAAVKRQNLPGVIRCFCDLDDEPPLEGCDMFNPPSDYPGDDDYVDGYPGGTLKEHRPDFDQIRKRYGHQTRQTHGFEFYDYPGPVVPIIPILNVNEDPDFGLINDETG